MTEQIPSELRKLFSMDIADVQKFAEDIWIVRTAWGRRSVVVRCPRCGRLGRLTVCKWRSVTTEPVLRVVHGFGDGCNVPRLGDEYDLLLAAWQRGQLPREAHDLFTAEVRDVVRGRVNKTKFWVVKLSCGGVSVVARCPKCGRLGRIVRSGKNKHRICFYFFHRPMSATNGSKYRACRVGPCHESFELVHDIWTEAQKIIAKWRERRC